MTCSRPLSLLGRKPRQHPPTEAKFDGDKEARLVALTCSEPPTGYGSWSLRLLAESVVELDIVDSVSHETIRQTLKKRAATLASGDVVHSP
ncbi:helix-turn-helix domain-containing protein [Leptothoe sp. PORK10 BA2]|uniref:helix-turn-helix domain-containing protein n=1 Tax=Leptothoe sp. PORK10 BA2 TaxID=3110254 RepID=UPI002B206130|nr:helix-turn-helix domain-containing protein [Leptothoe sp. PORK10 BA2]MEA5467165.1 helix-turn-helix domain-containing protein [Leptothoe sp. PORK10 BA2]